MKPHLDPLPLTYEDMQIFVPHRGNSARAYAMGWRFGRSRESDRRDAALMLVLRRARVNCEEQGISHCILAGYDTALAGWDDESKTLVELGLAMRIPKLP